MHQISWLLYADISQGSLTINTSQDKDIETYLSMIYYVCLPEYLGTARLVGIYYLVPFTIGTKQNFVTNSYFKVRKMNG